jgi:hypothetical protein
VRRRLPLLPAVVALGLAACGHGEALTTTEPPDGGPASDTLPRRLTFSTLDDRTPGVGGGWIAYSRQTDHEISIYTGLGREACIALLAPEGGTIRREYCPETELSPLDSLVDTWYEPVVSPDGRRIAYMWQRGYRISALGFYNAHLLVTTLDDIADTTQYRAVVQYDEPDAGRRANIATRIAWLDSTRLRFLATFEHIIKVKGGGAGRVTDTLYQPLALKQLDLHTGLQSVVPGGDSAIAWAPAPGGQVWLVRTADSTALLHLDPVTGTRTPAGHFTAAVVDLVAVDGGVVAAVGAGDRIEFLDTATGLLTPMTGFPGPVRRLAAAAGRRVVVEADAGWSDFGRPTDLWLVGF